MNSGHDTERVQDIQRKHVLGMRVTGIWRWAGQCQTRKRQDRLVKFEWRTTSNKQGAKRSPSQYSDPPTCLLVWGKTQSQPSILRKRVSSTGDPTCSILRRGVQLRQSTYPRVSGSQGRHPCNAMQTAMQPELNELNDYERNEAHQRPI